MRGVASARARSMIVATIGGLLVGNLAVSGFLAATRGGDPEQSPRTSVLGKRITRDDVVPPLPVDPPTGEPSAPGLVGPTGNAVAEPHRPPAGPDRRTPRCRNSSEKRCGRFYWQTDTATDEPLAVSAYFRPAAPRAGEPVTFFASASDPDARVACCSFVIDGELFGRDVERSCEQRYGPWAPPRREPGEGAMALEHAFSEPGTHTVTVVATSGDHCQHPYGGHATFTIEFVVGEAEADG